MAKKQNPKDRTVYKKPVFVKAQGLFFPTEIMQKFNGGRFCLQCAGCHSCK